ncbi:hypothetical protein Vadar_022161 [Vaccinium darrowii]|uniref:Uncharacterized protein n=1 Tax=Vaccinium darrowii TaxID=229202 RepID=A0ACB7YXC7_9ERIC|nr:hypothetical protein Vadar_022161 [Vaccinium darrowii]
MFTNLTEDALCKVLGPEKHGRLRTFGKGVTLTKLSVLSQMSSHLAQLHEENVQYKSQVAHMQDTIDDLKKNQAQNAAMAEGTPTTPIVSPSRQLQVAFDWTRMGEVVAEGRWSSNDPNELVHHIPLGPNAMRVWVDVPKKGEAFCGGLQVLWKTLKMLLGLLLHGLLTRFLWTLCQGQTGSVSSGLVSKKENGVVDT